MTRINNSLLNTTSVKLTGSVEKVWVNGRYTIAATKNIRTNNGSYKTVKVIKDLDNDYISSEMMSKLNKLRDSING